jgi:OOP family OmpA-OmpF porin
MKNLFKYTIAAAFMFTSQLVMAATEPVVKTGASKSIAKRSALSAMKIKNVQFAFNHETFKGEDYPKLNRIAKLLISNNASLKLGGYADSKGGYVYNWKLSKRRVDAVKAYLVQKGADSSRIAATEYGETNPIASNSTIKGRQKNRRVELQFID